MQCFLPYADFTKTFRCLDYKRLGNQRMESSILLQSITVGNGWSFHPASRMWKNYSNALSLYLNMCIKEWINRGYKNNMKLIEIEKDSVSLPPWMGDERLHSSHRASLLYKNPIYYGQFGWKEEPRINYFWPVKNTSRVKT
jgi:hypothetical protein